jgi:TorA maturation chaperone TorD
MTDEVRALALQFVAWARVWSPTAPRELRVEAWEALELSSSFSENESDYWAAFHVGDPMPPMPLVFHAALGLEGGHAREEWMRILSFIGLRWSEETLPPDHLAPGCEALAAAIDREDDVMVAEICKRYMLPWCETARQRLGVMPGGAMLDLSERFDADLRMLGVR